MVLLGTCQDVGQPVVTCSHSVRFYLLFVQVRSLGLLTAAGIRIGEGGICRAQCDHF